MSKQLDPLGTTAPELHGKKTIIIVGDSWACGEWKDWILTHRGLEQYLLDEGFDVINYGLTGGSNSLSYLRLLEAISQNNIDKANTKILFFWTDWHRDLNPLFDIVDFRDIVDRNESSVWLPKTYDEETPHRMFYRIFEKLQKIDLPIGIIGGCCDTIQLSDAHLPVYTACQSLVNLCLHDIDILDDPVYTIFTRSDFGVEKLRSSPVLLDDMEKANTRRLIWENNPRWFWPDGMHANRRAHRKLYDFLKSKNYL